MFRGRRIPQKPILPPTLPIMRALFDARYTHFACGFVGDYKFHTLFYTIKRAHFFVMSTNMLNLLNDYDNQIYNYNGDD